LLLVAVSVVSLLMLIPAMLHFRSSLKNPAAQLEVMEFV